MAKAAQLVVRVNATQFNQFQKDFQALSTKIDNLAIQFNKITKSITDNTKAVANLNNAMQSTWKFTSNVGNIAGRVTTHFARWAALIGGMGMLLGTGGFASGMQRLSDQMVQRRRQMLMLGGGSSYAGVRAAEVAGTSIFDDPKGILGRIGLAQGDITQQRNLMRMGIGDIRGKTPEQVMELMVKRLPYIVNAVPKNMAIPYARRSGVPEWISDADIMRFHGRQGFSLADEVIRDMKKRGPGVDDATMKKWTDMNKAIQNLGIAIETNFLNKLAPVAHMLDLFAQGLTKILNMISPHWDWTDMVKGFLNPVGTVTDIATRTATDPKNKAIFDELGSAAKGAAGSLWNLIFPLGGAPVVSPATPPPSGAPGGGGGGAGGAGGGKSLWDKAQGLFGSWGSKPHTGGRTTTPNDNPAAKTDTPATDTPASPTTNGLPSSTPAPSTFTDKIGKQSALGGWNAAANSRVPQNAQPATQMAGGGGMGGGGGRGPLAESNWQSSRVATINVNNVPGSNMFLTAASMSG
jgi:hypothetical protein